MALIYPSLLSADFSILKEEIAAVEKAGADGLHIDVMDGVFVPNITLGPPIIKKLRPHSKLLFDCHLMITNADAHLESFAQAGAQIITVHAEACNHLQRTLSKIRQLGCKAGVSINPATPYQDIEWALDDVDLILCMTVNPGFGGQALIPAAMQKTGEMIDWLKKKNKRNKIQVQIDGGVTPQNAVEARTLGVDILVAGSSIFDKKDYRSAISELRA